MEQFGINLFWKKFKIYLVVGYILGWVSSLQFGRFQTFFRENLKGRPHLNHFIFESRKPLQDQERMETKKKYNTSKINCTLINLEAPGWGHKSMWTRRDKVKVSHFIKSIHKITPERKSLRLCAGTLVRTMCFMKHETCSWLGLHLFIYTRIIHDLGFRAT